MVVPPFLVAPKRGKLHATPEFTAVLTPAYGETWVTTAVHGLGGCSGGPLCVRHGTGVYYPAAIYLGGSAQTVVRAIDPEVVELFVRAEVSSNGGGNNTSGGITHTSVSALGSATEPGSITVVIEPAEVRAEVEFPLDLHAPCQVEGVIPVDPPRPLDPFPGVHGLGIHGLAHDETSLPEKSRRTSRRGEEPQKTPLLL